MLPRTTPSSLTTRCSSRTRRPVPSRGTTRSKSAEIVTVFKSSRLRVITVPPVNIATSPSLFVIGLRQYLRRKNDPRVFYEICHRIRPNIALAPTWIEVIAVHEADLSQDVSEVRYVHAIKRLTKNNEGVLQVGVLKSGNDTEEERRLRPQIPPDQGKTSQIPSFLLWPYSQRPSGCGRRSSSVVHSSFAPACMADVVPLSLSPSLLFSAR